jgi:hypothetical protein
MTVNPIQVSAGQKLTVTGTGWPVGQLVDLSICGNGGDGGSANCNRSGAATVGVGGDGEFGATLMAVIPPVACPCVVRGIAGQYTATQPLDVVGAPMRTAPAAAAVPIVTSVAVDGSGPPVAWFGGQPERDVVLAVSNPSDGVVRDVRVEVRWGSEGSERSTVVDVEGELAPRSTTMVTTTIELEALTWGDVPVRARVVTTGDPTWVGATASAHPWGLVLLAILVLQLVVVAVVRRNRRIRRRREAELEAASAVRPSIRPDDGGEGPEATTEVAEVTEVTEVTEPVALVATAPAASAASTTDDEARPAEHGGARLPRAVVAASVRPAGGGGRDREPPDSNHRMDGPVTAAPWTPRRGS